MRNLPAIVRPRTALAASAGSGRSSATTSQSRVGGSRMPARRTPRYDFARSRVTPRSSPRSTTRAPRGPARDTCGSRIPPRFPARCRRPRPLRAQCSSRSSTKTKRLCVVLPMDFVLTMRPCADGLHEAWPFSSRRGARQFATARRDRALGEPGAGGHRTAASYQHHCSASFPPTTRNIAMPRRGPSGWPSTSPGSTVVRTTTNSASARTISADTTMPG